MHSPLCGNVCGAGHIPANHPFPHFFVSPKGAVPSFSHGRLPSQHLCAQDAKQQQLQAELAHVSRAVAALAVKAQAQEYARISRTAAQTQVSLCVSGCVDGEGGAAGSVGARQMGKATKWGNRESAIGDCSALVCEAVQN